MGVIEFLRETAPGLKVVEMRCSNEGEGEGDLFPSAVGPSSAGVVDVCCIWDILSVYRAGLRMSAW